MSAAPLTIKLRCKSWPQLRRIYEKDLARGGLFLKAGRPPEIGRVIRVDLVLPSESTVSLQGTVAEHVPPGGLGGRGPGIDINLSQVAPRTIWLIEQALASRAKGGQPAAPAETDEGSAVEDGAQVASAEEELVSALRSEYEALRKLNPFQVLGIGYDTTDAAVRAAFGELTRRYHPDRFARYQSEDARHYASEIFILVRDAYRKLGGPKQRERTLHEMRGRGRGSQARGPRTTAPGGVPIVSPPAARAATNPGQAEANAPPPRATTSIPAVSPSSGAERSEAPLSNYPDAENHIDGGNLAAALDVYRAASRTNPADRGARAGVELVEGLKALEQRDRLEAAQRFEAVLELDPTNERAARELAEMRRIATNERKGFLARLLGKKV